MWFYRSGFFPTERELIWSIPRPGGVVGLEIQVYDEHGELVKREEHRIHPPMQTVVEKVSLAGGEFRIEGFLRYEGDSGVVHFTRELLVTGNQKQYVLEAGR